MRQKLKYQDVQDFCCHVRRIVNHVTRVAAKITDKKTSEMGMALR